MAAAEAEECVGAGRNACPQVEGVPTSIGSCLLREGGGSEFRVKIGQNDKPTRKARLGMEGRYVGSAARAGPAWREIRFSGNEARYQDLGRKMWM